MRESIGGFIRDICIALSVAFIFGIIALGLGIIPIIHLSINNPSTPSNYTTIPTNSIKIGNCIFPLKLYNNMTAPQIENATLICYK